MKCLKLCYVIEDVFNRWPISIDSRWSGGGQTNIRITHIRGFQDLAI